MADTSSGGAEHRASASPQPAAPCRVAGCRNDAGSSGQCFVHWRAVVWATGREPGARGTPLSAGKRKLGPGAALGAASAAVRARRTPATGLAGLAGARAGPGPRGAEDAGTAAMLAGLGRAFSGATHMPEARAAATCASCATAAHATGRWFMGVRVASLCPACEQRWHKYGLSCQACDYVLYKREITSNRCPRCKVPVFAGGAPTKVVVPTPPGQPPCKSCGSATSPDFWFCGDDGAPCCYACSIRRRAHGVACLDCAYVPKTAESAGKACTRCGGRLQRAGGRHLSAGCGAASSAASSAHVPGTDGAAEDARARAGGRAAALAPTGPPVAEAGASDTAQAQPTTSPTAAATAAVPAAQEEEAHGTPSSLGAVSDGAAASAAAEEGGGSARAPLDEGRPRCCASCSAADTHSIRGWSTGKGGVVICSRCSRRWQKHGLVCLSCCYVPQNSELGVLPARAAEDTGVCPKYFCRGDLYKADAAELSVCGPGPAHHGASSALTAAAPGVCCAACSSSAAKGKWFWATWADARHRLCGTCGQRWNRYGVACTTCNFILYSRDVKRGGNCPQCSGPLSFHKKHALAPSDAGSGGAAHLGGTPRGGGKRARVTTRRAQGRSASEWECAACLDVSATVTWCLGKNGVRICYSCGQRRDQVGVSCLSCNYVLCKHDLEDDRVAEGECPKCSGRLHRDAHSTCGAEAVPASSVDSTLLPIVVPLVDFHTEDGTAEAKRNGAADTGTHAASNASDTGPKEQGAPLGEEGLVADDAGRQLAYRGADVRKQPRLPQQQTGEEERDVEAAVRAGGSGAGASAGASAGAGPLTLASALTVAAHIRVSKSNRKLHRAEKSCDSCGALRPHPNKLSEKWYPGPLAGTQQQAVRLCVPCVRRWHRYGVSCSHCSFILQKRDIEEQADAACPKKRCHGFLVNTPAAALLAAAAPFPELLNKHGKRVTPPASRPAANTAETLVGRGPPPGELPPHITPRSPGQAPAVKPKAGKRGDEGHCKSCLSTTSSAAWCWGQDGARLCSSCGQRWYKYGTSCVNCKHVLYKYELKSDPTKCAKCDGELYVNTERRPVRRKPRPSLGGAATPPKARGAPIDPLDDGTGVAVSPAASAKRSRAEHTIICVGCKTPKTSVYWIRGMDGERLCGPCGQRYNKYGVYCKGCKYVLYKSQISGPTISCPSCHQDIGVSADDAPRTPTAMANATAAALASIGAASSLDESPAAASPAQVFAGLLMCLVGRLGRTICACTKSMSDA